jgi:hypothetical protein
MRDGGTHPALRDRCRGGSFRRRRNGTPTTPVVVVGPGIPSSIEEGSLFQEEFFMPPGGATGGENSVPPWTRGDFRGVLRP